MENGLYRLVLCIYEEVKQREMVRELIKLTSAANITQNPNYGKPPFYKWNFSEAALFLAPIIKSESFREEEWRLISSPLHYDDAKFRPGNFSLIPYWEFELDVDIFTSIIIGPTPEPALSKGAVYDLLQTHNVSFLINGLSHSKIPFRKI